MQTKNGTLYIKRTMKPSEAPKGYAAGTEAWVPTTITTKGVKDLFTKSLPTGVQMKGRVVSAPKRPGFDIKGLQKAADLVYGWDNMTPLGLND